MRCHTASALLLSVVFFAFHALAQEPPDPAELDRAFAKLGAGGDTATFDYITAFVDRATGRYKIRVDAEERLLKIIQSRQTSATSKQFAANQLYRLCDEDTIAEFRELLGRSDTSNIARRGLEIIDHPKALEALLDALDRSTGSRLMGIIESLGIKGDPQAAQILSRTAKAGNRKVCIAALEALAQTPGPEAMDAIEWCRLNLTRPMRPYATDAYIKSGWLSIENGAYETAIYLFDSLLIDVEPIEVRVQGLRGLIAAERDQAVPTIIEALAGDEAQLQAVAAEAAGKVLGPEATEAFIKYFPDQTPGNQVILLRAFGERADPGILETIIIATRSRLPEVRHAAIEAAGAFNHPDVLQPLLKAASGGSEEVKRIAREALARLDAPRMNDALVKAAMSADNGVRFEAVKAIATRKPPNALPVLIRIAKRDIGDIRLESLKALGVLGTQNELSFMIEVMLDTWTEEDRQVIAQSVFAVASRSPAGKTRTTPLSNALRKSSKNDTIQLTLVRILGDLQDDSALTALETHARGRAPHSSIAALEVLANWSNDQPIETLQRIASTTKDSSHRTIAYNGFLRMIDLGGPARGVERSLRYYQQAAKIASTRDEKLRLIQSLSKINEPGALKILDTYVEDSQVKSEALRAKEGLEQAL